MSGIFNVERITKILRIKLNKPVKILPSSALRPNQENNIVPASAPTNRKTSGTKYIIIDPVSNASALTPTITRSPRLA